MKTLKLLSVTLFLLLGTILQAQVKIEVKCDQEDWNYQVGEKVQFTYQITDQGKPVKATNIKYQIGEEKLSPSKTGSLTEQSGKLMSEGMSKPGFLRCIVTADVEGKAFKGLATAAFEADKIQPTIAYPNDFNEFWKNNIQKAREVPLDVKMDLIAEKSTEKSKVYHISFQNDRVGSRMYGILVVPNKTGKFPALLNVPGAGIRPYAGDFNFVDEDIITLQIGIHGIPVNMPANLYTEMAAGPLASYPFIHMQNKDQYYYKRVYLGCVKAIDFIFGLEQFDGKNVAVSGGSQGGALAIVTAGLDDRIVTLRSVYPALSDVTGYLNNRAGGWPHMFDVNNGKHLSKTENIETMSYYDVVNFARQIKVPGLYSWGYNDETCPGTSMFAAYNVITAPKELKIYKETGHFTVPQQGQDHKEWFKQRLKSK